MNVNLLGVTLFVAGTVLIYAAIKDVDPRDVVKLSLQGKSPSEGHWTGQNLKGGGAEFPKGGGAEFPTSSANLPPAQHTVSV